MNAPAGLPVLTRPLQGELQKLGLVANSAELNCPPHLRVFTTATHAHIMCSCSMNTAAFERRQCTDDLNAPAYAASAIAASSGQIQLPAMKKIVAVLLVSLASTIAFAMQPLPSNAAFDTGFSPDGSALNVVVKGIESARASILVAAYTFTSRPVAAALLAAQLRGVKVAVIADRAQNSKSYSSVW